MGVVVRLAGEAGQGVQTAADLLGLGATRSGLFASAITDAESRIRGGINFSELCVGTRPQQGVADRVDILVCLSRASLGAYGPHLAPRGVILIAQDWGAPGALPFFLEPLAEQAGSKLAAGVVGVGAVAALIGIERAVVEDIVTGQFAAKPKLVAPNLAAVAAGYRAAQDWDQKGRFVLERGPAQKGRMWLAGHQALSLGAVAGGVSFMAAYPMSPSTAIITNLAQWSAETGVVAEQAEDEIAAINMVAGAAYAGARAMTATSGGGLCLMTEGISLLGMIEAPAVIALAQRPGPATGLATRTAQADLNLVRHAGHGFFPRIILAPQDIADCFGLTARAFDLAERYQVPVFVMTDQLLQDSAATVEPLSVAGLPAGRHRLSREELAALPDYARYAQADSGVSPLAAPGMSAHIVVADSHVHDEHGHYTEDAAIAAALARKRLAKEATVRAAAWPPEIEGEVAGRPLVICWGSTHGSAAAARAVLAADGIDVALLTLRWLWPLDAAVIGPILAAASKVIVVESSVAGHLAAILREVTLHPIDAVVTKLDGRPFTVGQLVARLGQEVR